MVQQGEDTHTNIALEKGEELGSRAQVGRSGLSGSSDSPFTVKGGT